MIGAALALLAAAVSPPDPDRRSLSEGIDHAIDFCANVAGGEKAELNGRIAMFDFAANPAAAAVLRSQGSQTTANAPESIRRFAETALNSRAVGHRDIVAIEAGDGVVWLVNTAQKGLCDIAVTGVDDAAEIAPAIISAVLGNANWTNTVTRTAGNMQALSFARPATAAKDDGPLAQISATVVSDQPTSPHGIQAELNFVARDIASPAPSTK